MAAKTPTAELIRDIILDNVHDPAHAAALICQIMNDNALEAYRRGRSSGIVTGRLQGLDEASIAAQAGAKASVQRIRKNIHVRSGFSLADVGGFIRRLA